MIRVHKLTSSKKWENFLQFFLNVAIEIFEKLDTLCIIFFASTFFFAEKTKTKTKAAILNTERLLESLIFSHKDFIYFKLSCLKKVNFSQ